MSEEIIIDNIQLHLPANYQGDPVMLARKLASQIQAQAAELSSKKNMTLTLSPQQTQAQLIRHFSQQLSTR